MRSIESPEDFAAQRREWAEAGARPVVTTGREVEHIELPGQDIAVLLSSEDTGGQMAVFEITGQPGAGAPPHHQTRESEYWYIVSGEWEVQVGEDTHVVGPGGIVLVPPMTQHSFRLVSDEPGKILTINAPGGHELFFREMSKAIAAMTPESDPVEILEKAKNFDSIFPDPTQ